MTEGLRSELKEFSILVIDIGGTFIKMMVIDNLQKSKTDFLKALTPHPATVEAVSDAIKQLIHPIDQKYQYISAGFPGVVQQGIIKTAPNMDSSWVRLDLEKHLQLTTGKPSKAVNDADLQGYGVIKGKGVELVITLGTGLGSALFVEGHLVPNLELAHHPFKDNKTYEQLLGKNALEQLGVEQWNKNLMEALKIWPQIFNYQKLYLGGGNIINIAFKLTQDIELYHNQQGFLGGLALWK